MERPVLVTGAAGFIGFHLSTRLLQRGTPVLGYDNLNPYYDPALKRARLAQLHATAAQAGTPFALIEADLEDRAQRTKRGDHSAVGHLALLRRIHSERDAHDRHGGRKQYDCRTDGRF